MSKKTTWLRTIVSGCEPGAERAALDAAIELGLLHDGRVLVSMRSDDGVPIPDRYDVLPIADVVRRRRIEANIRMGNTTLIFRYRTLVSRAREALSLLDVAEKQYYEVDLTNGLQAATMRLRNLFRSRRRLGPALNVVGPTSEEQPGVYDDVKTVLIEAYKCI